MSAAPLTIATQETVTWLHLSDWHQRGKDFDREVVGGALLADIANRAEIIPALSLIDFAVFSGDAANGSLGAEYETAKVRFFDPMLKAAGIGKDRLFIVPGNHDLDRSAFKFLPAALLKPFGSSQDTNEWLDDAKGLERLMEPFQTYTAFARDLTGREETAYAYGASIEAANRKIGLLGLNSALMCGRNRDSNGKVIDRGYLVTGEPQVLMGLKQIAGHDIRIAVMHHPFEWLTEFDANLVEERLGRGCHFILCGHMHTPAIKVEQGTAGDVVVIPAGASYDRRAPEDQRYVCSYNFTHLDLEAGQGTVYLRRWSERRGKWIEDIDSYPGGCFKFTLPKELGNRKRVVGPEENPSIGSRPPVVTVKPQPRIVKGKEFIPIPPGEFLMGTTDERWQELRALAGKYPYNRERPQHKVSLSGYLIGRYPVTNQDYKDFVDATGQRVPFRDDEWSRAMNWDLATRTFPEGKANHPVTLVSWHDAAAYCKWFGGRLPTEAEWEKAARGAEGREWPWGNQWQPDRCNSGETGIWGTTPVDQYGVRGESPYGVADMAGNVWEWCSSLPDAYPYRANDGREADIPAGHRAHRGGAWGLSQWEVRCAVRGAAHPDDFGFNVGFRVVMDIGVDG
jgi:formylglycine-generating enzyme required for sulfatase activity